MKKISKILLIIILTLVGLILAARLLTSEDSWICQDGQWVKHGNPSALAPTESCD